MSHIRFERLTKTYKGVTALDAVDLDVEPGSFTIVCGRPRSGKSVLLHDPCISSAAEYRLP